MLARGSVPPHDGSFSSSRTRAPEGPQSPHKLLMGPWPPGNHLSLTAHLAADGRSVAPTPGGPGGVAGTAGPCEGRGHPSFQSLRRGPGLWGFSRDPALGQPHGINLPSPSARPRTHSEHFLVALKGLPRPHWDRPQTAHSKVPSPLREQTRQTARPGPAALDPARSHRPVQGRHPGAGICAPLPSRQERKRESEPL